jgi:hypothetical protein
MVVFCRKRRSGLWQCGRMCTSQRKLRGLVHVNAAQQTVALGVCARLFASLW